MPKALFSFAKSRQNSDLIVANILLCDAWMSLLAGDCYNV